jgi:predicted amidohydrolase YtcJ
MLARTLLLATVLAAPALAQPADLVILNARVHTMDSGKGPDGGTIASAVCVRGSSITAVGDARTATACTGPATRRIDAGGRLLLPGFIDSHMHAMMGAFAETGINLSLADTPEKLNAALLQLRQANPGTGPIFARGWQNHLFGPQGPTSARLDAIFGDRVVILGSVDGHSDWFSSRALQLGGATSATPDPEPGVSFFERDAKTGALLGTAREDAGAFIIRKLIPRSPVDYAAAFLRWQPLAAESGLTALFDAGMGAPTEADAYAVLDTLQHQGRLALRMFTSTGDRGESDDPVARLVQLKADFGSELLRPTAVKLFADGVPEGHTAWLLQPYQDKPGFPGKPMMTDAHLLARLRAAETAQIPTHTHAIGGAAIRQVLNGVEKVRAEGAGKPGQRHAIAHMDLVDPADIPRFAQLGVIAQTSIQWATRDPSFDNIAAFVGEPLAESAYPIRSLLDAGVVQSFGTDWPAAAYLSTWKPLVQIEVAVTRRLPGARTAPPRNPAQAITVAEAVTGLTRSAAWQLGAESQLGSIEPGKRADLVLLDRNIFTADPFTIAEGKSLLTLVNGRIVHQDALLTSP